MDNQQEESWLEKNKTVFIFLGVFLILAIVIILVFFAIRMMNEVKTGAPANKPVATSTPVSTATSATAFLPGASEAEQAQNASSTILAEQLAEKTSFGDFYHPTTSVPTIDPANFTLPFNAKTEVANYYDVDRKISLDSGLNSLNNNGFAVLDNPFAAGSDNFFSLYAALQSKQVPALITGDFLIYYYQNVLKQAYKTVESTAFYENLWAADLRLYQVARQRYENNVSQKGTVSDVVLEASRLETAYFATTLSLLAPTDGQISSASGLSSSADFSAADASQYSLQLPSYLQDDVGAEVALIRSASVTSKSPVLLYSRDYKDFVVPIAYQANARLNNFYLASHWLNSVFPLFYRDAVCPNCLLDKDDWRINLAAAFLISSDLSADQNLQNRWAKIYKLQSFFSGLRDDLDYLNYNQVFRDTFIGKTDITQIIQGAPADNDVNLALLQDNLAAINFSALQGAFNKTATTTRPLLGLKMLTDSYWSNDYILSQLVYPAVGKFTGGNLMQIDKIVSACQPKGKEDYYRCVGSAYDILNMIHPLSKSDNSYFASNTAYAAYDSQAQNLQKMLKDFTVNAWHINTYWSTLDIAAKFLTAPEMAKIGIMQSLAWQKVNLNSALAAWANEELPGDIFAPYQSQDGSGSRLNQTGSGSITPIYQYVEPNLTLCRELIYNTRMIIQMLSLLNVSDGENSALTDLRTMEKNLVVTEAIIEKELQKQDLNDEDYAAINSFTRAFSVASEGDKSFKLPSPVGGIPLKENLAGVKLLVYSFVRGDQKLFAVGPLFNFREERNR
jgi:hypothetical protein